MSDWQQIHAQIDAVIRAIPEHYLLDPPDGGDVSVAEGVKRMADDVTALRADVEDYKAAVGYLEADYGTCCNDRNTLRAEVEKLRAAIKQAIRQHEEGNKGLAHRTLCEAVYGEQA